MRTKNFIKSLLCVGLAFVAGNAMAQDSGVIFDLNGFTASESDGVTYYANDRNSSESGNCDSFIYLNGDISNYDTMEFDLKWTEATSDNSKMALQMIDDAGGTLCFEVYTNWNTGSSPVAILRYPGVVGGNIARVELGAAGAEDTWMHIKAVASSSEIAFYVNDTKIYSGANGYGRELWRASNNTYLYTYNTKSVYRDIKFAKSSDEETGDKYEVAGDTVVYDFSADGTYYKVFSSKENGVAVTDGQLVVASDAEYKIMFPSTTPLSEFMVSMDLDVSEDLNINTGLYVLANNASNSADKIDAINVHIEGTKAGFTPKIFKFSSTNGYLGNFSNGPQFTSESGIFNLKVVVKEGYLYVFIDNRETPCISYELTESLSGDVGIRSQYSSPKIDNYTIKSAEYSPASTTGIESIAIDEEKADNVIYDLSGRRVLNPEQKGIYIANGKKVLVK